MSIYERHFLCVCVRVCVCVCVCVCVLCVSVCVYTPASSHTASCEYDPCCQDVLVATTRLRHPKI